jgi:hypothetical protein
LQTSPKNLKTL